MRFSFFLLLFFVSSINSFCQERKFKNQIGIVYKGIQPIDNENSIIVKYNNNLGLNYERLLNDKNSLGFNVFYSRSKFFPDYLGLESYFKHYIGDFERKVKPFVKIAGGLQFPLKNNSINFNYIWTNCEDANIDNVGCKYISSNHEFTTSQKIFYINPELGLSFGVSQRLELEVSLGNALIMRNFGNENLDRFLEGKRVTPQTDILGNVIPLEKVNSHHFELTNVSISGGLKYRF